MGTLFNENKQFRVLLLYQVFSGLGGGIFSMFMLLSVHLIYANPIYTGIAGFLITAPLVASFAVGPTVDRKNKVAIMRISTLLEFAVLSLLVILPFQDMGVWFLFAVVFTFAVASLFEAPAGTALLPQIVHEDEILKANSLMQIASMAGGIAIAFLLFRILGDTENMDFRIIYGISAGFIAIAFLFSLLLKKPPSAQATDKINFRQDLRDGFAFLKSNVLFFIIIMMVARVFFAEISYINMPMFAEYHVGAQGYVVLAVAMLAGGIIASTLMGAIGDKFKAGQLIFLLSVAAGAARIAFAFLLPQGLLYGVIIHITYSTILVSMGIVIQSLMQKIPPNNMVGRIGTLYTTFLAISVTIGALAGGFIGSAIYRTELIFIGQGAAIIIIGTLTLLVPGMRKLPKMNEIAKQEE
jgi:MFS family permease